MALGGLLEQKFSPPQSSQTRQRSQKTAGPFTMRIMAHACAAGCEATSICSREPAVKMLPGAKHRRNKMACASTALDPGTNEYLFIKNHQAQLL